MSNRGVGRRPDRKPPGEGAGGCGGGGVHGMQGRRGGGAGRSGGTQTVPPSDLVSGVHPSPVAHATMPTPLERSLQPESVPPMTVQDASSSVSAELLSGGVKQLTLLSQPPKELSPAPAGQVPPSTTKHFRFPDRPGFGTYGHKCVVRANYFLVQLADRDLYQYDVSITPEITSKAVNRKVIKQLVDLYSKSHFGGRKPAYDGRKNLYTAGSLPFSSKEFVVKLVDKVAGGGSKRRDKEFKVAIKFASNTDLHHLQQFLRSRQLDAPQETMQVLDVVLREKPSRDFKAVGRSFFHPQLGSKGELGNGVEYWSGYYQSLRPTQMGLCLNIDVSARSFYEPVNVLEFIVKYLSLRGLTGPLSDQDRVKVKKALKGIHVQLAHNAMRHKISSISTLPTSQLMFPLDDGGKQISVVQYFSNRYNIVLQYPFLPALQAGTASKPIYVPMEICSIVEGQRYIKKLNERQVTAMLKATCQRPQVREKCIMQIAGNNGYNTDELVKKEFGIDVSTNLASLNARVLPPPMLKYHDTGREARVDPRVGQWNMINKKMVNGAAIQSWACVNFSSRLRPDIASQFFHELVGMCESKGMVFGRNPLVPMRSADPRQIEMSLLNVHTQCNATGRQLELLIIILPDVTGSYGRIKRVCETELGIVSQCCQPSKAAKLSKQYLENVALKINVKAGGRNSVLVDAIQRKLPIVSDRPTIVFGADVTHPAPGEDSSPSIAAVVASVDWPEITKYKGLVSAQGHREEIISDLYKLIEDPKRGAVHGGMIREHLIAFYKSTGHKPHRIIFYRDGVSEGQFNQVLLYEMDAIRKACASLEEKYMPPVTFVVVQKRHHTRLFPADYRSRDLTDKSGNILPGTVVDATICHPIQFDFYLNSHAGIQGTSRPTHYHVLFDENRFSADALQILTNHLCYTYARCTRSVSIVPPAYYAHLVAFRARYYIEGETSESGSTSAGGQNTREANVNVWTLPTIKDSVKDVMFYC